MIIIENTIYKPLKRELTKALLDAIAADPSRGSTYVIGGETYYLEQLRYFVNNEDGRRYFMAELFYKRSIIRLSNLWGHPFVGTLSKVGEPVEYYTQRIDGTCLIEGGIVSIIAANKVQVRNEARAKARLYQAQARLRSQ